jgi:hypothetical protein
MDPKDQNNIRLDNGGRDVFDILAEHRNCQEDDAHIETALAEACAKQP